MILSLHCYPDVNDCADTRHILHYIDLLNFLFDTSSIFTMSSFLLIVLLLCSLYSHFLQLLVSILYIGTVYVLILLAWSLFSAESAIYSHEFSILKSAQAVLQVSFWTPATSAPYLQFIQLLNQSKFIAPQQR